MQSETLSYSSPSDPLWKRWAMRAIEDLSGRRGLLPVYYRWRREVAGKSPRMMGDLLEMVGARIELNAPAWPPAVPADVPLVIVANHPFGIGDGIALLALAEQLGRPARPEVLEELARVTQGKLIAADKPEEIVRSLAELPEPAPSMRRVPLWSHPALACGLVALLGVFWLGRKLVGLI